MYMTPGWCADHHELAMSTPPHQPENHTMRFSHYVYQRPQSATIDPEGYFFASLGKVPVYRRIIRKPVLPS